MICEDGDAPHSKGHHGTSFTVSRLVYDFRCGVHLPVEAQDADNGEVVAGVLVIVECLDSRHGRWPVGTMLGYDDARLFRSL